MQLMYTNKDSPSRRTTCDQMNASDSSSIAGIVAIHLSVASALCWHVGRLYTHLSGARYTHMPSNRLMPLHTGPPMGWTYMCLSLNLQ